MVGSIVKKLLEIPSVYSFVQFVAAPGKNRLLGTQFRGIFGSSKGWVLDIGCGPKLTTPPPEGILIGVDINLEYVRKYARCDFLSAPKPHHLSKVHALGIVSSVDGLPVRDDLFDECRCAGVLHHLPPASAQAAIRELHRCTRPGGRIIIFDSVMPRSGITRPLAWFMRKMDRGEWVRNEEQLLRLVHSAGPENWTSVRFTYSYHGLEGMIFVAVKKQPFAPSRRAENP